MADFQISNLRFQISNQTTVRNELQNGSQRLNDAIRLIVIQHAVFAELPFTLARFLAEQVAARRIAVLGFAICSHRKAFLDSLMSLLLGHDQLDGREVSNFTNFTAACSPGGRKSGGL